MFNRQINQLFIFPLTSMCTSRISTRMIPFRIAFQPGISLYEQVVYAAKKAMISGQMRPGDPFPSVRALSKELKINPNTAHKVVTHLVNEGLLEVNPGLGTVVAALSSLHGRRAYPSAADGTRAPGGGSQAAGHAAHATWRKPLPNTGSGWTQPAKGANDECRLHS